jgi:hypothetical protein
MVVASMLEHGESIHPTDTVQISEEPLVAVTEAAIGHRNHAATPSGCA